MSQGQRQTPAPWRYEPAPGARTWGRIVGADGTEVVAAAGEADALAMVAAPELAEALRDMVACFDAGPGLSEAQAEVCRRARAVLRKATSSAVPLRAVPPAGEEPEP